MGTAKDSLAKLTTDVASIETVGASVVAFVQGLAQQIRDNTTDPAALDALSTRLEAQAQSIADAITANTPAA